MHLQAKSAISRGPWGSFSKKIFIVAIKSTAMHDSISIICQFMTKEGRHICCYWAARTFFLFSSCTLRLHAFWLISTDIAYPNKNKAVYSVLYTPPKSRTGGQERNSKKKRLYFVFVTDGRTDRPTDTASSSVAIPRLNEMKWNFNIEPSNSQ